MKRINEYGYRLFDGRILGLRAYSQKEADKKAKEFMFREFCESLGKCTTNGVYVKHEVKNRK